MYIFGANMAEFNVFAVFLSILGCLLFVGCDNGGDTEVQFTQAQTERLLSNDSTKTWNLVSREIDDQPVTLEGCLLENELVFTKGSEGDASKLLFDDSCDENAIFDGYWEVLNQSNLPATDTLIYLFNPDTLFQSEDSLAVDHDTLVNTIDRISSQFLTISRIDTINQTLVFIRENYEVRKE